MSRNSNEKTGGLGRVKVFVLLTISMLIGAGLCGIIMFRVMPSMMIITSESSLGFDQTVAALEKSIEENGWVVSGVTDMNKSMSKHGVEFAPQVKLIKLCKPDYAKSVLEMDRDVSCMMPCTMSVWEGDDGKVYLSKINMKLMATMFGGNVEDVMGKNVASDEERILSGLLKN